MKRRRIDGGMKQLAGIRFLYYFFVLTKHQRVLEMACEKEAKKRLFRLTLLYTYDGCIVFNATSGILKNSESLDKAFRDRNREREREREVVLFLYCTYNNNITV
ncbi:hypothetical protein K0M31_000023 [Melipona bicolor]|uniref:Uncharacterized protein n=1 Tax=Melipona bicolor TaxID=60889 RepID=A0AA40GCR4_9HYME|nr:hypothetical protein K0M31_000023 [Melipona bicolor]